MNHSFNVDHAMQYGHEEAIMIYNFQFWITKNKANNKHKHEVILDEGTEKERKAYRFWTYNSIKAFGKLFPYWGKGQIDRILRSLIKQGVLIRGRFNKIGYDRTLWYAFYDEEFFISEAISRNQEIEFPKPGNRIPETGKPIPDLKPDLKPGEESSPEFSEIKKPPLKEDSLSPENGIQKDFLNERKAVYKGLGDLPTQLNKHLAEIDKLSEQDKLHLLHAYRFYLRTKRTGLLKVSHPFAIFWAQKEEWCNQVPKPKIAHKAPCPDCGWEYDIDVGICRACGWRKEAAA